MKVDVKGGGAADRRRVAEAAARVGEVLPWDGVVPVTIGVWPGAPARSEACANSDGVWLKPVVIANGPPGREQYILYEEFAHYVLGQMGVGHSDIFGIYFQELFAAYVQFPLLRHHHPELAHRLEVKPVPRRATDHRELFHSLGRHSGAALAGEASCDQMLVEWMDDDGEDLELRQFVAAVGQEFATAQDARELADLCASYHRRLVAEADAA